MLAGRSIVVLFLASAACSSSESTTPTSTCPSTPPMISGGIPDEDEGPCELVDGTICNWASHCPPGKEGGGNTSLRCAAGRWRFVSGGGSCVDVDSGPPPDTAPADTGAPDSTLGSDAADGG